MDEAILLLHNSNMTKRNSGPTSIIPTYELYGEDDPAGSRFWVHCETIPARSALHHWEIGLHRHERYFQILLVTGGSGDDLYLVDNAGDVVTEADGEGSDTVRTTLNTYALTAQVEDLEFAGTGNFSGTGNARANAISGGPRPDTLDGAAGAYRDAVLLNAAAALVVADKVGTLPEGVALARTSIDSGAARTKVQALARLTNA